jgi:hypothetical protein
LRSIPSALQLKQSKISQHNYFSDTLKYPFKKTNLYRALSGKLFSKKKSKKENIYFQSTPRINKSFYTRGSGLFFHKLHFLRTHTTPRLNKNIHCFKMFLNNRTTNVNNSPVLRPVMHSDVIKTNTSYSLLSLNSFRKSSWHTLITPRSEFDSNSPTNLKLSQAYYVNLQPKSVNLVTRYQLLKSLTSRYGLVRKIWNNWERFSNWKDHSLRFPEHSSPTLSIKSYQMVNLAVPRTLVGALPTPTGPTQFCLVPKVSPVNLFNKLFTKKPFYLLSNL